MASEAAGVRAIRIVPPACPGALPVGGGRACALAAFVLASLAAWEDGFTALTALEDGAFLEAEVLQCVATAERVCCTILEFMAEERGWDVAAG